MAFDKQVASLPASLLQEPCQWPLHLSPPSTTKSKASANETPSEGSSGAGYILKGVMQHLHLCDWVLVCPTEHSIALCVTRVVPQQWPLVLAAPWSMSMKPPADVWHVTTSSAVVTASRCTNGLSCTGRTLHAG